MLSKFGEHLPEIQLHTVVNDTPTDSESFLRVILFCFNSFTKACKVYLHLWLSLVHDTFIILLCQAYKSVIILLLTIPNKIDILNHTQITKPW